MADTKQRRAIYFDLDTNEMKKYFNSISLGYACLKRSFQKQGFTHRQGSGYISQKPILSANTYDIIEKVTKENPWLCDCVNKIDVTVISKQFEMTGFVKGLKNVVQQLTPAEQKAAKENELQAKLEMSTGKSVETLQQERSARENSVARSNDVVHDR